MQKLGINYIYIITVIQNIEFIVIYLNKLFIEIYIANFIVII